MQPGKNKFRRATSKIKQIPPYRGDTIREIAEGLSWGEVEHVLADLRAVAFHLDSFSVLQFDVYENLLFFWSEARINTLKDREEVEMHLVFAQRVKAVLIERDRFLYLFLNSDTGATC